MDRSELLKSEKFVWFERSISPGTRYVRAMFAPPNTRPHSRMLWSKFVYGWTLDKFGVPIRIIYAGCEPGPDGLPDGCGDYHSDPGVIVSEAGTWVGVGKPLGPIPPTNSTPELCAEERMARREIAEYHIQTMERQKAAEPQRKLEAENKALAAKLHESEVLAAREQAEREKAELAALRAEVPRLREQATKKSWLASLTGR